MTIAVSKKKKKRGGRTKPKSTGASIKRHFSLAPETFSALEELKKGLKKALPHTVNLHTYTFAMEQAVHYTLNAINGGELSYTDLFQVPRGEQEELAAEEVPE